MSSGGAPEGPKRRIGRYEICEELGKGGMGVVYLARDHALHRNVAIKVIRRDLFESSQQLQELERRFAAEALAAARLNHPGIVTVYDFDVDAGQQFFVMEYVKGTTLGELLSPDQLNQPEKVKILRQVASALDYAHSEEIVHRDIKPLNIIVTESRVVKIMDFGIAKISGRQLTTVGTLIGTLPYMSPEQVRAEPVSGAADRWSLAVTAYEMLTGRKPFAAQSDGALIYLIFEGFSKEPAAYPECPAPLIPVFRRALSKDPNERFSRCEEFVTTLAASIDPGSSPPPAPPLVDLTESAFERGNVAYSAGRYPEAVEEFQRAAEAGHAQAMYNLARLYENGHGIERNPTVALAWYRKAAGAGLSSAMNRLGLVYERGEGVVADRKQAIYWYQQAVSAGNDYAADNLRRLGVLRRS